MISKLNISSCKNEQIVFSDTYYPMKIHINYFNLMNSVIEMELN